MLRRVELFDVYRGEQIGEGKKSLAYALTYQADNRTLDAKAVLSGVLLPGSINDKVTEAYQRYLFAGATLQDLPDRPRFVINAANVQSGALWRFSKPYMRDYKVGEVRNPLVTVAQAVAASSAFPPFLSPARLARSPTAYTPGCPTTARSGSVSMRPRRSAGSSSAPSNV